MVISHELRVEFIVLLQSRDEGSNRSPNLWIVRGGADAHAVSAFFEQGYAGIGFGLQDDDLSLLNSADEIRTLYLERNPGGSSSNQVIQFCLGMKPGDYVVMPGPGSRINHYGRFTSDVFNDGLDPYKNKRNVEWSNRTITREELDLSGYRTTVTHLKGEVRDRFLGVIANRDGGSATQFKMPEDSWVPFHLEVGRKLIEGEWWLPERRQEFEDMIDAIRWADSEDVGEDYEYERWAGDPFSFYLSFNMRTTGGMRVPAYRKIKELMQVKAEVPEDGHEAYGLGVGWGWDPPLTDEEISFLWDFFRLATEFEPTINSTDYEDQFINFYDRAASASFLSGMRARTLSYLLYWIDPTKYVLTRRLRSQELGLLDDLRELNLTVSQELTRGAEYMKAVGALLGIGRANEFTILDVNRKSTTREMLGLPIFERNGARVTGDDLVDKLLHGVFFDRAEFVRIRDLWRSKMNLVLQGAPGVGKTFMTRKLAYALLDDDTTVADGRIVNVQFHQSYSYEDFVIGYRPSVNDQQALIFVPQPGSFLELCEKARRDADRDYVIIIDEVNRGNLSRVFGELLSMIEADKRGTRDGVRLPVGMDIPELRQTCVNFSVPKNVYILGTMNLADRSLAGMDYAMRRRFAFVTLEPQFREPESAESVFADWLSGRDVPEDMITRINDRMSALNRLISTDDRSLGPNFAVGHSYFCDVSDAAAEWNNDDWDRWYNEIVDTEIRPLLEEYWFDDPTKASKEVKKLRGEDV